MKDGVTYDDHTETIKIEVTDGGEGKLNVTYNGKSAFTTPVFTNNYNAKGEAVLSAQKAANENLGERTFTFVLTKPDGTAEEVSGVKQDQTVTFETIKFDTLSAVGTYTYTIHEVIPADAEEVDGKYVKDGVTYDDHTETIEIVVTDGDKGTLNVTYNGKSAFTTPEFTNTYAANGEAVLSAKKAGKNLGSRTFSFELNGPNNYNQTIDGVKQDQTVTFETIKFDTLSAVGTYTYTIHEVIPADAEEVDGKYVKDGVTYDDHTETIEIVVTDGNKGTLNVTYNGQSAFTTPVFTNNYNASGEAVLGVKKAAEANLRTRTFSFELKDNTGKVIDTLTGVPQNGEKNFKTITFENLSAVGTYNYTINEKIPEDATEVDGKYVKEGVTYDGHTENVKIVVADAGDGTLTVTYNDATKFTTPVFTNEYSTKGEIILQGEKELKNREMVAEQFTFELKDEAGQVLQSVKNDASGKIVFDKIEYTGKDLKKDETGSYVPTEMVYTISEVKGDEYGIIYDKHIETVTVTLTDDGKGTIEATTNPANFTAKFSNGSFEVKVSKVDVADGKELEGAHIQILDKDGKVVEEWDSTEEAHVTENLKVGEEYTLRETVAPDGYTITSDTIFTISETGKVRSKGTTTTDDKGNDVLLVEDTITSVKVSKVDVADGKELEGAKIQIIDEEGNVVAEWTSGTEAHEVTGLKTGVTYTLHEEVAPDGYTIAADTEFTIDEHGKVTSTGTITDDGVMLIEDAITSVKVSKVDADGGAELEGAVIQIIDEDGNVVAEWTSGTEPYEVKGLITGKTYTLHEVTAPDGYEVTSDTTFVIDETGKVTSTGNTTTDTDGNTVMLVEDSAKQTKATVIKVWEDGENQDGVRPMSLMVTLTQTVGGTTSEYATVTLNAGNAWTATVDKLPVMVNGVEATYSWSEGALTLGYELKSAETQTDEEGAMITTLTNEKEVEKTEISVTKVWEDEDNAAGLRPESISVTLYADGEAMETLALSGGNGWSYTWSDLDRNRNESGLTGQQHEIAYTVAEGELPEGYTAAISGSASGGYVLTNTYEEPKGTLIITKSFLFDNLVVEVEEEEPEVPEEEPQEEELPEEEIPETVPEQVHPVTFENGEWNRPALADEVEKPKVPGNTWYVFDEYETPLGVEVMINHVGDCFD